MASPISGSAICRPSATATARRHDGEADEPVGAGVIAVGDERGALEPAPRAQADHRRDLVPHEADGPGDAERQQVVDVLRVEQAVDGLEGGDARAEEDRRDDEVARALLRADRAQQERGTERDRRRRVADVVDQVGEQRHAAGGDEDERLRERRERPARTGSSRPPSGPRASAGPTGRRARGCGRGRARAQTPTSSAGRPRSLQPRSACSSWCRIAPSRSTRC